MNRAIRTDLAIELREDIKDRGKIDGIEIETRISQEKIKTTIIHVNDQTGADTLGKPVGTYITIECPEIREFDEDIHKPLSKELAHDLKKVAGRSPFHSGRGTGKPGGNTGFAWATGDRSFIYNQTFADGAYTPAGRAGI